MKLIKHVGKIANTGSRCVVVLMQIPNREDHALVIPTDALPDRMQQAVMDLLESNEGQMEANFYNVLNRRIMESGKSVLQHLHEAHRLEAVPVSNILMLPAPNMPFPLEQILIDQGKHVPVNSTPRYADAEMQKFNPHTANQRAESIEAASATAKNLLIEADMLQESADRKRRQAYDIAPHLEPVHTVTTDLHVDGVATAEKKVKASNSRRKAEKNAS